MILNILIHRRADGVVDDIKVNI